MDIGHVLKDHAYQNIPLTFEEAYALGMYALQGCGGDELAQHQSISALCALHNRATYGWQWSSALERHHRHQLPRNAAEQIAGVCAAVFEHDIAESPSGFLTPHVAYAMDNCGMGGDLTVTANVSTISGFPCVSMGHRQTLTLVVMEVPTSFRCLASTRWQQRIKSRQRLRWRGLATRRP